MNTQKNWRSLNDKEINLLIELNNHCDDWSLIQIKGDLPENYIRNCRIEGSLHLDHPRVEKRNVSDRVFLSGLQDSTINHCCITGNASVLKVDYLSGYLLEEDVLVCSVTEMIHHEGTSYGQGFISGGKAFGVIEPGNELGTRWILPYGDMLPTDIRLWMSLRGNKELLKQFSQWSTDSLCSHDCQYGRIASSTVIKNCTTIQNIQILGKAVISGAIRLVELTISGTDASPVSIQEGSDLSWGIIQQGALVSNSMAEHFYMAAHSNLTKGARFIHSCLSENSTVSCCEVISVFTGAFHEQHHNNSFLIASTLEGQSNVAAGATIGSNHNSRSADGEIRAGRGFWPALNLSLKHNSRFASFTLISRGQYPFELNIGLPFSLVSQNESELQIMPAYWQQYNLYALMRNSWKFQNRDKRTTLNYLIETHWLAPDTVTEINDALAFLQDLLNVSQYKNRGEEMEEILLGNEFMENSNRPVRILKPHKAIWIYQQLIHYHFTISLLDYLTIRPDFDLQDLFLWIGKSTEPPEEWINLSGTPISKPELADWENRITSGKIKSWQELHELYLDWMERYPLERLKHSLSCLVFRHNRNLDLKAILESSLEWESYQWDHLRSSRNKDISHPFRHITYDSDEEKEALLVSLEKDPFIIDYDKQMKIRIQKIQDILKKL